MLTVRFTVLYTACYEYVNGNCACIGTGIIRNDLHPFARGSPRPHQNPQPDSLEVKRKCNVYPIIVNNTCVCNASLQSVPDALMRQPSKMMYNFL